MTDLIFWYTGATIWVVIALIITALVGFTAMFCVLKTYYIVYTELNVWTICHAIGVKRDFSRIEEIRKAAHLLAESMNECKGLHTRHYTVNDVKNLITALQDFMPEKAEK